MSADPESRSLLHRPEGEAGPEERLQRVSRRGFLKAGAGAAAVLMTAGPAAALTEDDHHHFAEEPPKSAEETARLAKAEAEWYEEFAEPPTVTVRSGPTTVEATLRVIMVKKTFEDTMGTRTEEVRTYNGIVPGPVLRVRPGDRLNVKLVNDLPKNTDQFCADHSNMNNPHCFNTTNLHVHGLHVSPKPPSDNVFIEIPPKAENPEDPAKGEYNFCFQLPAFHKPGTHWYHAHKHGSTALQLVNGMAGALIVEDPPDKLLNPLPSRDIVMMIQEIVSTSDAVYNCQNPPSVLYYIDGKYRPTLDLIAGEVYRFRFINSTSTPKGFTPLELRDSGATKIPMNLIAVDGIYLPDRQVWQESTWTIAPGNRADFLIRFNNPGSFTFYKAAYNPTGAPEQALAELKVTAPATEMTMAMAEAVPRLPDYLTPFTDAEIKAALDAGKTRTVTFDLVSGSCPGKFRVDNKAFDPADPGIQVNLGDTEIWTVKNNTGAPHPFHIHVNPFQVIDDNGTLIPAGKRYWQDTVIVPKNGYVQFATRFLTFDGPFVLHCHILIHEDWGMMKKVVVNGNGAGPCTPVT